MLVPPLSLEEPTVLAMLFRGETTRDIATTIRGWLALYCLISETPQGGMITEAGKSTFLALRGPGLPWIFQHDPREGVSPE